MWGTLATPPQGTAALLLEVGAAWLEHWPACEVALVLPGDKKPWGMLAAPCGAPSESQREAAAAGGNAVPVAAVVKSTSPREAPAVAAAPGAFVA